MKAMTFQRIANSIVTRLILLGVAIVLLGAAARYYLLSNYLRDDLGRVVASQQESMAQYVASDVEAKLVARSTMLDQMAATFPLEILGNPAEVQRWLAERYVLQPLFTRGLFMTDANGITLADYPKHPERAGLSYADRDYIQSALKGERVFGRPLASGRITKEPILPLAVPIKDDSGRVRAVLVGITALNDSGFLMLPGPNVMGQGNGFLVVSPRDKVFVASSQPDMLLKPTPPPGRNPLHDRAMAGYRGSGLTVNAQGVEEISGIASVPSTGWFVVARVPASQALASVQRAQQYVAGNSIVILGGFLLLAGGGMYVIFRPLFSAASHADRMTRGELPLEPLPVVRNDEVGHLTEAFNRLLLKLKTHQAELEVMAHHDALTGLPNRILLADRLGHALSRAQRNGWRVAVLYLDLDLDLDGFKPINDRLGHEAGDLALKEVARRLSATVRESDTLARLGGDEFMVLMGDLEGGQEQAQAAASEVARKCLEAFELPMELAGQSCLLSASIGVAVGDGSCVAQALRLAADGAMYQAKQAGGQRFVLVVA
jgi:diguanylate cyclase (GGDEF)-like protein